MGRSYTNHGTATAILICACVVMAASDVTDTSSSSSSSLSSARASLAKILDELRHLTQPSVQRRPARVQRPASDADPDIGETRWSIKRDPEWDNDYGWGGGRFGKRRDESRQV